MNGLKDLAKGGWQPKGRSEGGKETWRGDFKGVDTVAGWMGKKKTNDHERAQEHTSTPLNQLQDPSSFGPPPKRSTFGSAGGARSPTSPATTTILGTRLTQSTGGLGAPLSREQLEEDRRLAQERIEEQRRAEEEPKAPVGPYKRDTTGLNTTNLPPPPKFRGAADGPVPSPAPRGAGAAARAPPPSLPPRLPPRQNSGASTSPTATANAGYPLSPPPDYSPRADPGNGVLNQGALNRLGAAGVQVPGLGIGTKTSPPPPARSPAGQPPQSQLGELQSRFSRLNAGGNSPQAAAAPTTTAGGGTTWAQKQAALKTASNFHKDPSSVSMSDARSAATTANSFRERHGEQVASGWKAASGLNQKYGISDRFGGGASPTSTSTPSTSAYGAHAPQQETGVIGGAGAGPGAGFAAGKKKPPPPPPAKRVGLGGGGGGGGPPPVPMGTKPSGP